MVCSQLFFLIFHVYRPTEDFLSLLIVPQSHFFRYCKQKVENAVMPWTEKKIYLANPITRFSKTLSRAVVNMAEKVYK